MRLLLAAVRALPEPDQDAVLALLLQGLTRSDAWDAAVRRSDERRRLGVGLKGISELRVGGPFANELTADAKVVPIRFPRERYEEFKAWCEEHNFPMAAVVRGLVERFLESQELP